MTKKRHHYVPVSYLKRFCADDGMLSVYRKDAPLNPFRSAPSGIGFRRYYYEQTGDDGSADTDSIENLFSNYETIWPELVDTLISKRDASHRIAKILEFMALQRGRVPAARDAYELMHADVVLATAKFMNSKGMLPPLPEGVKPDFLDSLLVSIKPELSLAAIPLVMNGCERVFSKLGFSVLSNNTSCEFLTSDNPVIWYDPRDIDDHLQPYGIDPERGPIELLFPITPRLMIYGATSNDALNRFATSGLTYGSINDVAEIRGINKKIVRFAYEAVFARDLTHDALVQKYAATSPVMKFSTIPSVKGQYMVSEMVFGARRDKAKWTGK